MSVHVGVPSPPDHAIGSIGGELNLLIVGLQVNLPIDVVSESYIMWGILEGRSICAEDKGFGACVGGDSKSVLGHVPQQNFSGCSTSLIQNFAVQILEQLNCVLFLLATHVHRVSSTGGSGGEASPPTLQLPPQILQPPPHNILI